MLKTTISKQKQDKERLLSLSYIERTKEKDAQKLLSSDLIKVILGPRRAGKSVFALMLLKEQSFAYFNFDDESLPGKEKVDLDELMMELKLAYGETKYILFDEIQNLPNWELFVNRLHRDCGFEPRPFCGTEALSNPCPRAVNFCESDPYASLKQAEKYRVKARYFFDGKGARTA